MAGVSDADLALARVYSDAMIELAQSQGEADLFFKELADFQSLVKRNAAFRAFIHDPTIDVDARRQTLEKLFRGRYSDLFVDSLQVMNAKGRLGLIDALTITYHDTHEGLMGRVEVFVKSAAPLNEEQRDRLRRLMTQQTGKEASLIESVDESLIGGLEVRVGDRKLDGSVATWLRKLAHSLRERASREIHAGRLFYEGTAL